MKKVIILLLVLISVSELSARKIIVDKYGLGTYTSINTAIQNAVDGDTVKVYPGIYAEKVTINKKVVVQGSGAETTLIYNGENDYAVVITDGELMWFRIQSNSNGLYSSGGSVYNCIILNCNGHGIFISSSLSKIFNSMVTNSSDSGIYVGANGINPIILNCIIYKNYVGIRPPESNSSYTYNVRYCNVWNNSYNYHCCCACYSSSNRCSQSTGSLSSDPLFDDYQISTGSPCKDAGDPGILDPDGTRSDMGYYGGSNAPTFPVMTKLNIIMNIDGTINLNASGISKY